ncbi:uncharacterized protein [Malus domestica]|uniref:uncharacterized protein n=1 Tax=Malus domestica TaxID=3750 RepID=UPI0039755A7A
MDGDVEGDDEEEKEEGRGSKRRQRSGWGCKWFRYAFQVWAYRIIPELEKPAVGNRELKIQIKELKVALTRLAHVKDISKRKVLKKEEKLTEYAKELRREIKEKHVDEKNDQEEEEKDMEKQKEEDGEEEEEEGKEEEGKEKEKDEEDGSESGGYVQNVVQ